MKARRTLGKYTGKDFYGMQPQTVLGLEASICHGTRKGTRYSYVTLKDDRGIKWKIIPTLSHNGRVHSLRLYHRNSFARKGFHSQHEYAWGTPKGVRDLLSYIEKHEKLKS